MSDIYRATRAAYIQVDGQTVLVSPKTTVRAGHPILDEYPGLFEPIRVQYDVDESTETTPPPTSESQTATVVEQPKAPRGKAAQAETR